MGDVGDTFRAMNEESQESRAEYRRHSVKILQDAGIEFESKNAGAHLIIKPDPNPLSSQPWIDFWPGTGLWIVRPNLHVNKKKRSRGIQRLIKHVRSLTCRD